jgi:hypothetical protein
MIWAVRFSAVKPALIVVTAALLIWSAEPDTTHFGPGGAFQLEYSSMDGYGLQAHGVIERVDATGQIRSYPLPQSSFETYARLRPEGLKLNPLAATGGNYERNEVIGPHQVEGGRLWFGNNYYDGEGERGVGTFGYFDSATRQYSLFSPPEVAAYEVGSILVEKNDVWVALDRAGEGTSTSGGLVRWNAATHQVRRYPLEFVVTRIAREGNSLRLTTSGGYASLTNDLVHRFRVNGATTTPIDRFPPPPSKDQMQ